MQKFIVSTISVVIAMLISTMSVAQTYSFDEFASLFQKNQILLSTSADELLKIDTLKCNQIDCDLYNWIIQKGQKEKARRCNIDGEYFHAAYGMLSQYDYHIYALGYIQHNKYNIYVVRVESHDVSFIDMYIYNKNGEVLSMLCLYEAEYSYFNNIQNTYKVYIRVQLPSIKLIHYEENRYGVNVKIDYQLQDDGILKEVAKSIIGQYEVVDKDGYVNVREKPDAKSKVLYTIESGSVIISHSENGSKWEEVISIEDSDKKGGYIHSSRLRNYW